MWHKNSLELQEVGKVFKDRLCVEDLLGLGDSVDEAIELRRQIQKILAMMKIELDNKAQILHHNLTQFQKKSRLFMKILYQKIQKLKLKKEENLTIWDPEIIS